ncbi:IS3 family transposase [Thermosyntropha sp.]
MQNLFYNTKRLQKKLKGLAPMEFRSQTSIAFFLFT